MSAAQELGSRIEDRHARVGIVGLGYAGLPLAVAFAEAGFPVTGYDRRGDRVEAVMRGDSYVPDVDGSALGRLVEAGRLQAGRRPNVLRGTDVAIICVPTPLDGDGRPDTSVIERATAEVANELQPGALVVVESTSYPGTTESLVGPILAARGLRPGREVFLAFSPERVDPGNRTWTVRDIPKVVGAVDRMSLDLACALYQHVAPKVVPVSSPAAAEMAKLLENVFREVNIALANEMAQACERLGLDAWEVIDAAATKPFGFMPFYPGPGRGGHCIPSDPVFLDRRLRELGFRSRLIPAARGVNERMPLYAARRVARLLEERGVQVRGARVLVLGVTYKPDVADTRDSPAIALIDALQSLGAKVAYHDPHVASLRVNGTLLRRRSLETGLAEAECVVVVSDHSSYDWDAIVDRAVCVLDCRGVLRERRAPHVRRL